MLCQEWSKDDYSSLPSTISCGLFIFEQRTKDTYGRTIFQGFYAAYLGANFFSGSICEWQIDLIKENISHYCESLIDHSQIPDLTKEEQKCQMKQNLELLKFQFLQF